MPSLPDPKRCHGDLPQIPFRNSKLTFLLQNCFRGDGKTLMMVNLSPHASSTNETLCSLRFANTVSQVRARFDACGYILDRA